MKLGGSPGPFLSNERGDVWYIERLDSEYKSALTQALLDLPGQSNLVEQNKNGVINLPSLVCRAIGGELECIVTISKAWKLLYAAFYLLDKIEDQELSGIFSQYDTGVLVNITTGLILQAEIALINAVTRKDLSSERGEHFLIAFNHMALAVCAGQHQDLSSSNIALGQAWEIAAGKSGVFFAFGCRLGAYAGAESSETIEAFTSFGHCLGLLIQLANDVEGLWGEYNDLNRGKVTIPIAYAMQVLQSPEKDKLVRYLDSPNTHQETTIRNLILTNGALVYMALEAEKIRQLGKKLLDSLALNHHPRKQLEKMLDQIACFTQIQ